MFRKLLIAFVVLVVVLGIAADRVGEHVAAHVLAGKLETDEHLSSRPSVSISGIPFLTQALGGSYHDVTVVAHDFLTPDRVVIDTLTAHLHGVHLSLSKVISGSVSTVPVDRVDGSVFLSFVEITKYLAGTGVSVTLTSAGADEVHISIRSARLTLQSGTATIGVSGSAVVLAVRVPTARGGVGDHGVADIVRIPIPLQGLPFRFTVTSVEVGAYGISGTGTAHNVVLGS